MRYELSAIAAAPTDQVWRALVDIESWPRWMSSYTSIRRLDDGPLQAGSRAELAQPGLRPSIFRVTSLHEGREFTWASQAPGVRTTATHVIRPRRDGSTHIALAVVHTGPLALLARVLLGRRIRRFLAIEAAGLARAGQDAADPG